ncbi:hypothetical protein RZS08_57810, partial [Arthrospira platensis SPKY1]|nr:hypothetical protein [Arthrospira platensis SPKY1]
TLEAEDAVLHRQDGDVILIVIDAGDEMFRPEPGLRRHGIDDVARGPAEIEDAETVIDVSGQRTAHFGNAAAGDAFINGQLPQAQVGVHEPEGEGGIAIGLGFDERHLML